MSFARLYLEGKEDEISLLTSFLLCVYGISAQICSELQNNLIEKNTNGRV